METVLLIISILTSLTLIFIIKKIFNSNKLANVMAMLFLFLTIWCTGLVLQKTFFMYRVNISPICFDYLTYIGICLLFPTLIILSIYYRNNEVKFDKSWILMYVIPSICLLFLWTNEYHHLFYKVYSINFSNTKYGPVFYLNTIYSYCLAVIFVINMIKISVEKSGFFSKQTALMVIGSLIPLVVNMLGTTKIINISIYITPMLFCITLICYSVAVFKYKALNVTPVALSTVTDTMSDAFVVISEDGTIVETNLTFRNTFKDILDVTNDKNLFDVIKDKKLFDIAKLIDLIDKVKQNHKIEKVEYNLKYQNEKFFEVDIHPLKAKRDTTQCIGFLLLFKDITQHKLDIREIEEKQEIIVKQGQLVSIGELAGGVAHDINTPISAIKTGITILNQKTDRTNEEKEIIQRMDNCATKIITIVNSMRNQIRNLGGNTKVEFKISDVINDIKVITYHELFKNKCELECNILDDLSVLGDPTKLGQVLTNLIVNASQAYKDKGGKIQVSVEKVLKNSVLIKIADFAGGIPDEIKPYIFKNILTTKGTKGTGLGLYLAYSIIKGEFNGELSFDSEVGMGTTFYILLPLPE